ncbi:hypothetical protein K503DRAFT_805238 [Rhizopogon vinicolor AM-OR11-026]|uniref:Protein kinase domain-containing protein n=1 Tax=Rhizopogon vinicolor AM-OR11-026 TaxID=1314800 RepID=A0A1B7MIK2_9AGAM|nr:hypothetical protein K503DRAFT_805238 [Rhizopogon vinicolor AM-OR11-026]
MVQEGSVMSGNFDVYTVLGASCHCQIHKGPPRIRREAYVWVQLLHDHILLLEGITDDFGPLPALCDFPQLSDWRKLWLVQQVAAGLSYLHAKYIVHDDLTVTNVFVDSSGSLRIADLALLMLIAEVGNEMFSSSHVGNLHWLAPDINSKVWRRRNQPNREISMRLAALCCRPSTDFALIGPGQVRDVETMLTQLRSVVDIPTDSSLPMNIYHSFIHDYVSDTSNCGIPQLRDIPSPHSILALSSFRLMMKDPQESTTVLDVTFSHVITYIRVHRTEAGGYSDYDDTK